MINLREKRQYLRREVFIPVRLECRNHYFRIENIRAVVTNLSLGGAFVSGLNEGMLERFQVSREDPTEITILFNEPPDQLVQRRVRIVWSRLGGQDLGLGLAYL